MRRGIYITSILHVKIHKLENKIYEPGERNEGKTTKINKRKNLLSLIDFINQIKYRLHIQG